MVLQICLKSKLVINFFFVKQSMRNSISYKYKITMAIKIKCFDWINQYKIVIDTVDYVWLSIRFLYFLLFSFVIIKSELSSSKSHFSFIRQIINDWFMSYCMCCVISNSVITLDRKCQRQKLSSLNMRLVHLTSFW